MLALGCASGACAVSLGAGAAETGSAGSAVNVGASPGAGAAPANAAPNAAAPGNAAPKTPPATAPNAAPGAAGSAPNATSGSTTAKPANAPTSPATSAAGSATGDTPGSPPANSTSTAPTGANAPATPKSEAAAASSGASAPASAASVPAASSAIAMSTPFQPSQQLRYGNSAVFRNLIPSSMLEGQAAEEFDQIVRGADHAHRLYPPTDPHVERVRTITDKLIPYSLKWSDRTKHWKWDVAVIRSPDIRIYGLPGGKIIVYSGMLDRVKLNDNELGMLIGHEIAHALREHARERLGEQQAAQLGSGPIPQLFGLADLGASPLGIGSQLLEMKYERADETEADVIGSEIASRGGYDPRAAVTLWDKLAIATRNNRDQGFIYVHPYTTARRQDIIKRLSDMLPLYAKAIGKTVDTLPEYQGAGRSRRTAARE
ncbi:M48 family metallopeptidase [Paraburkholderia edwinii]|uniref:M48 family metallopeptidase n=2 Tax=Paraburkholderia edwinii TaxID=2861782 RepID=A0ABX8UPC4_9BURK|nr:M48 family metallopeptidase [Paraburkholderia edwinii]